MFKPLIFFLIVLLIFTGCENFYDNKPSYKIKVGETFKIYISQNSCCQNCLLNEKSLKSIKYLKTKLIYNPLNKGCNGCNDRFAWIFKGVKVGSDTIKIYNISGGERCNEIKDSSEVYAKDIFIVTVTD